MFVQVYDKNILQVGVVDLYTSLIWTKRYNKPGDFKVTIPIKNELPEFIDLDHFVTLSEDYEDGYYMMIESMEVDQEAEKGTTLTISGRSLEALLERRVIWDKMVYASKTTEWIVKDLIEKSFISPSVSDRKIANFVYEAPDFGLTFPLVNAEYDGENVLDIVSSLCSEKKYSISVRYLNGKFIYKTYSGTDRSHDQTQTEEVLYSEGFDSLVSSNYLSSVKNYKNVVQVVDSTGNKKLVVGNSSGINRREYRATPENVENQASLKAYGNTILYRNGKISVLDGVGVNDAYEYGRDIFVGDIVQFQNSYGVEGKARITEYIYSEDASGVNAYPTFEVV